MKNSAVMIHEVKYAKVFLLLFLISCLEIQLSIGQTVKDVEGNEYRTGTIGKQVWMAENLRTTKYRNGDLIPTTPGSKSDIRNEVKPIYQWTFSNTEKNTETYGRLYTWYAVTDNRGVCPVGWHVPTDAEWTALVTFLGGEVIAYTRMKEVGNDHWLKYDTGSNDAGFYALPGGLRTFNGTFEDMGISGNWWTATEYDQSCAWYRHMKGDQNNISRYLCLKRNGLSVRCVKTND